MSINISQGFNVCSPNPIDSRMCINTINDMLNVDDSIMPTSYVAVCNEDGKIYSYLKSREMDPVTGKFRVVAGGTPPTHIIYGMHVDGTKSNPAEAVTYIAGCDNENFTPAGMNFDTDTFSYGSWENAFFIPRPCMLKYDGTVDYYLDPNNYTKREDGVTNSDVYDTSYEGNAMMEWGRNGKKIWYKVVPDPSNVRIADVYISDECVDNGYNAWSFIGHDYQMKDHFYTAIYNGTNVSNKLRSLSAGTIMNNTTQTQEETYAKANGDGWNIDMYCDRVLINLLLMLMGKTLAPKEVFGLGNRNGGSSAAGFTSIGSMNTKGLFWGKKVSSSSDTSGVKVFGMENWWGCIWRRTAGLINASGRAKYKMCYGVSDGTNTSDYNANGAGYLTVDSGLGGTSGGYISVANFGANGSWLPVTASGSKTTYYEDGLWFNNSRTDYALFGGDCSHGALVGPWYVDWYNAASHSSWRYGASPSFK